MAAKVADTVCKTCVGSEAIVAALEVAVGMSSSENDAFVNIFEAIPIDEMLISETLLQRYGVCGQKHSKS
jgi:hypothetical protein